MLDDGLRKQPIMIGKRSCHELRLMAHNSLPCPFTIITSIGHLKRATSYTREPVQLSFQLKPQDPPAHLFLRCAVTDATNYNILVG
jgi:hypothetical protein